MMLEASEQTNPALGPCPPEGILGGHLDVCHLDQASLMILKEAHPEPRRFVDIGCGPGWMVQMAKWHGFEHAVGYDGDPKAVEASNGLALLHDFRSGPIPYFAGADIAWCVEFLEHVPESALPNVFEAFKKCKLVLCTASPYEGPWHCNVQPTEYWVDQFLSNGFQFHEQLTTMVRQFSNMVRDFVRTSGMVFVNAQI